MTKDEQITQLLAALKQARDGFLRIIEGTNMDGIIQAWSSAEESLTAIDAVMGDMEGTCVCAESHGKRPFESDTPPPTTSQSDECRAAFEEWRDTLSVKYAPAIEACMLASWQASRAQYKAELVRRIEDLDGFSDDADRIKTEAIAIINGGTK